jgi:hypothetical protein
MKFRAQLTLRPATRTMKNSSSLAEWKKANAFRGWASLAAEHSPVELQPTASIDESFGWRRARTEARAQAALRPQPRLFFHNNGLAVISHDQSFDGATSSLMTT